MPREKKGKLRALERVRQERKEVGVIKNLDSSYSSSREKIKDWADKLADCWTQWEIKARRQKTEESPLLAWRLRQKVSRDPKLNSRSDFDIILQKMVDRFWWESVLMEHLEIADTYFFGEAWPVLRDIELDKITQKDRLWVWDGVPVEYGDNPRAAEVIERARKDHRSPEEIHQDFLVAKERFRQRMAEKRGSNA